MSEKEGEMEDEGEIKERMHEWKLETEKNVPSPTERAYEIAAELLILFIDFCVSRGDVDALFPPTVPLPSRPRILVPLRYFLAAVLSAIDETEDTILGTRVPREK